MMVMIDRSCKWRLHYLVMCAGLQWFVTATVLLFENCLTFTGVCATNREKWVIIIIKRQKKWDRSFKKDKQTDTTVIYCRGAITGISTPFKFFHMLTFIFCLHTVYILFSFLLQHCFLVLLVKHHEMHWICLKGTIQIKHHWCITVLSHPNFVKPIAILPGH